MVLGMIIIALVAAACAPAVNGNSTPVDPIQPVDNQAVAPIPVTGASAPVAARAPQEPRLQAGEIFLSDNSNPDYAQNAQTYTIQKPDSECMSEDSEPKRQGGCIE